METKGNKGGKTRIIQRNVFPHVAMMVLFTAVKQAYSLSPTCTQLLLIIAYYNGKGATIATYMKLIYNANSKPLYVSLQHRLNTLLNKGLIERYEGKYRLSAEGVRALSSVTVEGEGARLLAEIERKQAAAERRRAKSAKLSK